MYADGHAVEASVQALETNSTLVSLASGPNVIDIEGSKADTSPCHRYRDDPKKSNRLLVSQPFLVYSWSSDLASGAGIGALTSTPIAFFSASRSIAGRRHTSVLFFCDLSDEMIG